MTTKLGVIALAGPDNGGTYQYTLATLQALHHATGFDVTVYGDPNNPDFAKLGYPIVRFGETRAQQLTALAAHRLHLRLPDPFVAEDIMLAPIYSLALLHTTKPFVYTLHDLQEKYYPQNFAWWQRAWRHQIHRSLLGRARRVICESGDVQNDIVRFFGVEEKRTVVIPAPPQLQFLSEQGAEQLGAARARLKLPEKFLFYPAQFWAHKNHLRLIEAFRSVADRLPDLGLVLTGKQRDEYQTVMNAIGRLGLNDRVLHLGYVAQDDLQAVYQLAAALVMPSLFESVSIPIYEAFQVGTPVIASAILAIPEQVGDAGLLFDPTSVPAIRDAILEVLREPAAARERTRRGRDRMLAMTRERYAEQLQAVLRGLA
ncbi:glycosyltransferase family 4 protein [Bradyrhizobium sp.]|uniref:glycosyltransferase family 4 protein n=1 Tax=Bradyrhizobium sp. TaxID=376 RepID=UPI003C64F1E6